MRRSGRAGTGHLLNPCQETFAWQSVSVRWRRGPLHASSCACRHVSSGASEKPQHACQLQSISGTGPSGERRSCFLSSALEPRLLGFVDSTSDGVDLLICLLVSTALRLVCARGLEPSRTGGLCARRFVRLHPALDRSSELPLVHLNALSDDVPLLLGSH